MIRLALFSLFLLSSVLGAARKPNFVLLFADDLGYGDLSFNGNPSIKTPNLDAMVNQGIKFTSWYSGASVCSPSRSSLLTGRQFVRSGTYPNVYPCDAELGLPNNETTIPEMLKQVGYKTAIIGKWHLGQLPEYMPTKQGFDEFFGLPYSVDQGSLEGLWCYQIGCPYLPLMNNTHILEQPTDIDSLAEKYSLFAEKFITKNKENPFFLMMSFSHAHVSVPGKKQYSGPKFANKSPRGAFGDAVMEMDWLAGSIYDSLKENGVDEDTLIFFFSDNGPWMFERENGGSPEPFSGAYAHTNYTDTGKDTLWEGGIRMPAFALWPGHIKGSQTSFEVVSSMDILPTLASLSGAKLPSVTIDGRDMSSILLSNGTSQHDFLWFWRSRNPVELAAVRHGPWKAHWITQCGYCLQAPVYHDPPLLFNVDVDPAEMFPVDPSTVPDLINTLQTERQKALENFKKDMMVSRTGPKNISTAVCGNKDPGKCFWPN